MDHSGHEGHEGHHGHDMTTPPSNLSITTTEHIHHEESTHTGHSGHGVSAMDHMMKMYFHTGVDEIILFKSWTISTAGGLLASMIGIFLMAILYEGLKYYREYLFRKSYSALNFSCINNAGDGPKVMPHPHHGSLRSRMLSFGHVAQTALHVLQVTLSYFLMLIFMTYNVWLCLAVVLGAGVGFFVFGWKKAIVVDITEHCH